MLADSYMAVFFGGMLVIMGVIMIIMWRRR